MEKRMFELVVPDLGDTERIELVKWYKKPGDFISIGEEVLELVTDKAAFPMESSRSGILREQSIPEGGIVRKGQVLGILELD